MSFTFEWHHVKAKLNVSKHGVEFEEATSVFDDSLGIAIPDPDHSVDEERFVLTGLSSRKRYLLVTYTERVDKIRIISARQLTRKEKAEYEDYCK